MIIGLVCLCVLNAVADNVRFTASAPDAVAVGDQFRLSYKINTTGGKNIKVPSISGFEVLMGPSKSTQSSVQIVNGKTSSESSVTYTYILLANKAGTFTLPAATIEVNGQTVTSNSVSIKVVPADQSKASAGSSSGKAPGSGAPVASSGNNVSQSDIFITAHASKTRAYEQEAILLTYKIYTAVDLRGFDNVKMPDFKGFQSQEVELPTNRKWDLEHYKGRNYRTTIYRQFVLFPQQSGRLTIDQARFDASIMREVAVSNDPFDIIFGSSNYVEVKKSLLTPQIGIEVQELPEGKPDDFSGGVGDFNISSSINSTNVKTNDAVTIKVVISGIGNFKLITNPEVKFPENFEVYDPKVDNKFKLTNNGLTGNQVIEYLAIPRDAGDYKIPPVTLSYFDINTHSYKTLTTEGYDLHVEKGKGDASQTIANFTNKEDLRVLNEDIRFIKLQDAKLHKKGATFFGTPKYWLWYLLPLLLFGLLFALNRRRIAENANVAKMKNKKANKVAAKRLKQAEKLLRGNQKEAFYDEVLKALLGYTGDKLNIPVSELSKDNIREKLLNHGVDEGLTQEFIDTLDNCEFARFAPGDESQAMDKVYNDAVNIISKMENSIKR